MLAWAALKSEFVLILVLALLGGLCYVAYRFAIDVSRALSESMGKSKRFEISSKGINIKVKERNKETTLDSAQRFAYKAWQNSKAPDSYKGRLKYRDRTAAPINDASSATKGANMGWA
ncbi:hypothetical protein TRVA0_005S00408 [Trichomonascus vanleenenianus]|uniref:uncharacterized protein n=1 Tax=Trichomonascus vanleenenianus TaxID=2268995 RepID=UPI003ECAEBC6